jgi:hypothetical protein
MAAMRKDDQRADEDSRADHRHLLNVADEARRAGEFCQFGQVDEDESQHHYAIEDALHDDRGKRCGDWHAFFAFEDDGA